VKHNKTFYYGSTRSWSGAYKFSGCWNNNSGWSIRKVGHFGLSDWWPSIKNEPYYNNKSFNFNNNL